MNSDRRAELKRAYKEAVPRRGVFAIRCSATGQVWVDASTDVDSLGNRIWFTLRMGSHPNRALQQAWNESGPEAMQYEVVEVFAQDVKAHELERLLKDRKQHWLQELHAEGYQ